MSGIDREALVRRHNPRITAWDPASPLSVGNGDFAFTVDCTGLQTFDKVPPGCIPLATMSQWGWHSYPDAPRDQTGLRLKQYAAGTTSIGYMTDPTGQEALFDSLRKNPHRFNLGRIALGWASGRAITVDDLAEVDQTLDMYSGVLSSRYLMGGQAIAVETCCHPGLDLVAIRLESNALANGELGIDVSFPYASHTISGSDWDGAQKHSSTLSDLGAGTWRIDRILDDVAYRVVITASGGRLEQRGAHEFLLLNDSSVVETCLWFSEGRGDSGVPSFDETKAESQAWWNRFWNEGGALSFAASQDKRAVELERRVISSQYLLAIQSLGSLPPQETGLTCNSWFGKFHLEMHVWHAAWAIVWNHPALVERSLGYYRSILGSARQRARQQGYRGVRWPKMTDPSGADSPSTIGPLLCWQQPHPIYLAELLYRNGKTSKHAMDYAELVFESAAFMADYARWDTQSAAYVLGPPVIPAQENHDPEETFNPLFELEYWRWGLRTAIEWKHRLGDEVPSLWKDVADHLSPCPLDGDHGRYAAHAGCRDTYGEFASDHPSFLLAYGFLPAIATDSELMSASYDAVLSQWRFETMWGWDFPAMAMTAARLGRRRDAVDILLVDSPKNTYLADGHNKQGSSQALPLYLPGNGALLLAVAMMAVGWDASNGRPGGFPDDGSWTVIWEDLETYL